MRYTTRVEDGIRFVDTDPRGTGAVYLLVHGLGGSLEQWIPVIGLLSPAVRVIAVDVPGFGLSRTRRGDFDLASAVARISDLLRRLGVGRCVVVSHSISCVVAAGLAAARPDAVKSLVLVSGALVRASEIAQNPFLTLRYPRLGTVVLAQFLAGIAPAPKILLKALASSATLRAVTLWPFVARPASLPTEHLVESLTGSGSLAVLRILLTANAIDYHGLLSAVEQPVALVIGDRDRLIVADDIARLRKIMNVTRVSVIRDCGHWPWLENPAQLAQLLTATE
ncbi:alpha/beta fold hydrolase [Lentzea albidocapillata]|uniref:Pimeloyl-ACP methyl ester carboxylesterase n=1 Tax=Lentzea albidocapillata TaxID=40571 RepID=A0A1W2FSI0_9PSEU|nr:alpha/beta hydrolase [Lentzea albidocapillata]SMD24578.1 Pimeloyl-ACP methyl ester carboxylesterase [Lentzea albidocapillata]